MPTTRVSRTLSATPDRLWKTVSDPHHLPRWWPRVERVESVEAGRFTEVLRSDRGRAVRADFRLAELRAPRLAAWEQELEGTPFERIMSFGRTEVRLEEGGGGARVTLEQRARLRGFARLGGFMVRRAARRQLREAMDGLERLHG